MSTFEKFVRPFESGDIAPPQRILPEPVQQIIVRITPGIVGSTQTFSGSASSNVSFYMDSGLQEVSIE